MDARLVATRDKVSLLIGRRLRREDIDENLELAYAVSIHKAQGSEFDHVYFVVPKHKCRIGPASAPVRVAGYPHPLSDSDRRRGNTELY